MRVATWNVNSLRTRWPQVVRWLESADVDVLCLQETKCTDADVPFDSFEELGFETAHHGRDQWNGVAILSRVGLADVQRGFSGPQREPFDEARIIMAVCDGVRVASVYVPNGRELTNPHYAFKLVWLERLRAELAMRRWAAGPAVVAGDFNVAPADIDVYDPSRYRRKTHTSAPEREAIKALLDVGFRDVFRDRHPGPELYTWWNYQPGLFDQNRGLRIDLMLVSDVVAGDVVDTVVHTDQRAADRPSDHAPVSLELH